MTSLSIIVGPYDLTVSSSGPAGKEQDRRMGVYLQSGETHNNKPVWSRHDGTQKLFYSSGKGTIQSKKFFFGNFQTWGGGGADTGKF